MLEITLKNFQPGEEEVLLEILGGAFGGFEDNRETRKFIFSRRFEPTGCFVAREGSSPIGCVAVTNLPRQKWFVARYLAVKKATSRIKIAEKLLEKALQYAESKESEFLRATTPAVQPYVDIYKSFGFKPVRRDFRVSWDIAALQPVRKTPVEIIGVSEEMVEEAADACVKSLSPHWDWRTQEQGGPEAVARSFEQKMKRGEKWLAAYVDGKMAGLAGFVPDFYSPGETRFWGAYVLPEYRGRGVGLELMNEMLSLARKLGQHRMIVYTFSHLDCLAPGAVLYLKSGGKFEAEYLQLQRL